MCKCVCVCARRRVSLLLWRGGIPSAHSSSSPLPFAMLLFDLDLHIHGGGRFLGGGEGRERNYPCLLFPFPRCLASSSSSIPFPSPPHVLVLVYHVEWTTTRLFVGRCPRVGLVLDCYRLPFHPFSFLLIPSCLPVMTLDLIGLYPTYCFWTTGSWDASVPLHPCFLSSIHHDHDHHRSLLFSLL